MIILHITDQKVGRTHIYEWLGQKGGRRFVPTYHVRASLDRDAQTGFDFTVSRDSSAQIFEGRKSGYFGEGGECPPNTEVTPFHGLLHSGKIPFGIRIFEPWCKKTISLRAPCGAVRTGILIHHGPARSDGCFMVGGGKNGFVQFQKRITALAATQADPANPEFRVYVDPR